MPAKYNLEVVKDLVRRWLEGDDDKIWFTPRKKSYGAVSFLFREDDSGAQETIARGFLELNPGGFCQQLYLSGLNASVDVYGLENYRGHNWYVKFYVLQEEDEKYVAAISFHPLDQPMKCEDGKLIKTTYFGERPWKSD